MDSQPPPSRYSVRKRVLQDASAAVLKSRNANYGPPDQDFRRTAEMVTAMWAHKLNDPLTTANVAQFIACVKLSRMQHSPTLDNWVDLAGYAACGAECEAIEHGLLATWGLVEEEAKAKYPEPVVVATIDMDGKRLTKVASLEKDVAFLTETVKATENALMSCVSERSRLAVKEAGARKTIHDLRHVLKASNDENERLKAAALPLEWPPKIVLYRGVEFTGPEILGLMSNVVDFPSGRRSNDEEARFYLQRHQDDTATIVIQAQEIADLKRSVMVERRDHQESIVTYNRERDDLVRAHTALAKAPQVLPIL